jgi:phosphatidylglycerophosphate synthase
MAAIGVMPREVRLVILSLGLIIGGILGTAPYLVEGGAGGGAFPVGALVILVALAIITIGSVITVIQRILHVRNQAKSAATTSTK